MHAAAERAGVVLGAVAVVLTVVFGVRADTAQAPLASAPATPGTAGWPLRIMPMGSSSTVGAGSPATAGYRGPLEAMLTRDGIAYDMVGSQRSGPPSVPDRDHEGHGGWTMARMQPYVAGWVTRQRPDIVLLQVGTNDLNTGAGAAATARRLDTMLTTIRTASPAHVVVAGVWAPLRKRLPARAEYARLAAAVVARHRATGQGVTFVDTSALLGPADLFDGLHPDAAGYRKIAALWDREIRGYLRARH
ncbi:GDSL-type esterase/lipase family protein [Pseudonocardia sp.]|uniref:GDSL-type esterase/lipase family protein n=1 Tax=Pseudonocardia sp. TaxID=60912 RepID=UPI00261E1B3C|nr:GDSL-type esterase/lipase family protein [Pseudonocardia sp.]MCW2722257.1 lipolytic protein family [Pseudonocardia sp.]